MARKLRALRQGVERHEGDLQAFTLEFANDQTKITEVDGSRQAATAASEAIEESLHHDGLLFGDDAE